MQRSRKPESVSSDFVGEDLAVHAFVLVDITDPIVAWHVYRGEMVSASAMNPHALSSWHIGALRNRELGFYDKIEVPLEKLRIQDFPNCVSRLRGFYCFPDLNELETARNAWGGGFEHREVLELRISENSLVSSHDANWITNALSAENNDWMRNYWIGEFTEHPQLEMLVEGRALILGTHVRNRARETIERIWPETIARLELGRLESLAGLDGGLIMGYPRPHGSQVKIEYFIRDISQDNVELHRLLADPAIVKDLLAIRSGRLSSPNLMAQSFYI